AVPIKDDKGKVVNVIEIARDITEEKKTQEQLIHAQRMEDIGILAGGIAHDFRNMLTPIIGFAQLIKISVDKSSPLYDYADNIISAGENAASLAQGLLAFSRKQILDIKPVIIDNLINDFSKIISRVIGEDIELKFNLNSGKHLVMADVTQIQQVLMNLVANARDAMPKGGILTISTEVIDLDENFIKIHGFGELGRYILITVSDTGVGMDEATKPKIFEPFFTTKPVGKGTGLGLSIVYGIVKQHKGYINVYSELGIGTTFRIYLPVAEEREEVAKEEIHIDLDYLKGEGETILLVEDDEIVRSYMKTVLEEANYRVIEAKNGQEGIDKFIENKDIIQLVLHDIIMPVKNGKEVLEEIKIFKPEIKYIFMSGYTSDIIFERGIIEKDIEYISKPISPVALLQKVKEVLSKS
ncbi:MAG: ATP-binding protein, partial [Thermodesulfovibrio sp.]|nr:ATP-binding protein [Thermodesulfovibrio sp.]